MGDEQSTQSPSVPAAKQQTTQDLLADIFGSSNDEPQTAAATLTASAKPASAVDDIMGLFGNASLNSSAPAPATNYSAAPVSSSASTDLFSALGNGSAAAAAPQAAAVPAGPQPIEAYHQNGLRVTLTPQRDNNNKSVCNILAKFIATEGSPITAVNFQAAVPKTQKLQMLAMSNTEVQPGKTETQQLRVMVSAPGVSSHERRRST